MLNDRFVRNAKPGTYADGGGLYLRVSDKGKKSWLLRVQKNGKNNARVIGTYPEMSLAEARCWEEEKQVLNSQEAAKAYMAKIKLIRPDHVEPMLAQFPDNLASDRKTLVEILQRKAKKAPVMANRMLTRWKDFLNFCVQQGWLDNNVLDPVQRRFIGGKENGRNRVLSWDEISAVLKMHDPVLSFILLTGLRPSEAIWVLKHKRTVDIPVKRTPTDGYRHTLPRSHLVKQVLKQHFVLPASHLTVSNKLRRKSATFTPHDLRRTFATRLGDIGVLPHVVEKLLGHKMQGVMAVYNHADYWPERNEAQKLWDKKLIELLRQ